MTGPHAHYDALVIGAGFGGMYALHKLRDEVKLSVHLVERGSGLGGTWFWNRYPGAMSDTESPFYRYSFDNKLLEKDAWRRKYIDQPDILAYLERVADDLDLRRDMEFGVEVKGMSWDEERELWTVRASTEGGERIYTARFVVTALGLLAAINVPDIPGIETFKGKLVHTAEWPADFDVKGRNVGVIGTGSTGTQFIVAAARTAQHLTVFQRSPQYSVPSGNGDVGPGEVEGWKRKWTDVFKQVRSSTVGFGFTESTVSALSVSEQERERIYEDAWNRGNGFYFMFGTFNDIATNPEANETAAAFIRKKIAQIVKDPTTAQRLTPHELYAKRPLCNHNYFEVYNQPNVKLVSLKETPIERIVPEGVLTADGTLHKLDTLVLATGFDAVDGNYRRMDLRGRGGTTIDEHWQPQPTSYLGIATRGFPNMFMVMGPNGPFTNLVPAIEVQVEFITKLVAHAVETNGPPLDVTAEAEDSWTETCKSIADMTLFPKIDSWIFGANIPGKQHSVLFYLGGLSNYLGILSTVEEQGFKAFAGDAVAEKTAPGTVTHTAEVEIQ